MADAVSTTRLLYDHHSSADATGTNSVGKCYFCGREGPGVALQDAINEKYFSDHDLREQPNSDHVCAACAYCLDTRSLKQGHWVAHSDGVLQPSTGDLLDTFRRLRGAEFTPPLAIHVTSSPIRSSHAYLWTPLNETATPLSVAYDRQTIRIHDWTAFGDLLAAIEDLRLHSFTFDEIRTGEPRVGHLRQIGREAYRDREDVIRPHRRTARLELALTLSRGADDQPRTDIDDEHTPLA